jgi:uncharacterized damage-inducible protein DinB
MKQMKWITLVIFALLLPALVAAQDQTKSQQPPTISSVLDSQVKTLEREFVPAAEAMPADKFNFAPSPSLGEFKDSRTFAQQVSHVAATNYMFGAAILGEKPPVDIDGPNENGPASLKTQDDVIKYLKDSFTYVHKAIATITPQNAVDPVTLPWGKATRLGVATLTAAHGFDHYGQMAIYLRLNGIIPPASRPQPKK